MTDKPLYSYGTERAAMRSWVLSQMLHGAGWAAAVLLGIGAFMLILRVIARFLPVNPNAALDLGTALMALV